jgi:hypothetical protein
MQLVARGYWEPLGTQGIGRAGLGIPEGLIEQTSEKVSFPERNQPAESAFGVTRRGREEEAGGRAVGRTYIESLTNARAGVATFEGNLAQ